MNRNLPAFFLALAFALPPLPAGAAFAPDEAIAPVMQRAVDDVIVPGYKAFEGSARAMAASMNRLCTENSPQAYDAAMQAFSRVVADWSHIEILRDGPALDENRFERILFFPDAKGLALKQVQALLAKKDETEISGSSMKGKSVAIQGLTALEFVLAGAGKEELAAGTDNFRCHAGRAIAANIASLSGELSALWSAPDGVARNWKAFGPDNPVYRNGDEALIALLGTLVRGIETINEKRVTIFYPTDGTTPNPKKALYWRSGLTMSSVADNLEGLRDIWDKSGMQGIIKGEASTITTNINFEFKTAIETARKLDAPPEALVSDERQRSRIEFLQLTLADLQARLNNDYGRAMGLSAGFTFSDGD